MVSIEKGLVVVAGERSVLIPPTFITALQDMVMKEKGEEWRKIFYEAGKKALEEIAPTYKMLLMIPRNSEISKKKIIDGVVEIWSWMSCGRPEVTKMDFKRNKFTYRLYDSVIAKPYIGRGQTMCDYFSGVIAGGFGSLLGAELNCREIKCIANGDEFCEFEIEGV